jgi:DNA primase
MARIPNAFIDELLARVDIVEVIESRVPLKRAGREHKACCPFHDERSPSFTVSGTKQFYHCFGCGVHGSAIKFLMDYDRMEFVDAVEELAGRVGLKVPYEGGASNRQTDGEGDEMYAVLDAAARFYQRQLPASAKSQSYLKQRGLNPAIIQQFGLGYAPDSWDALKSALGSDERKLRLLDKVGMLSTGERGSSYDKFRDRLMFPIHDRRGRVIAFGGRVMGDAEGPKYLNSPETPLFHKGRELFALHQVRTAHSKIARLIVVEGYMDVIALFQFGITQAVATLGTATTKDHAELLFRNSADVYFCFDGDRAGRSAAWRAVESVLPRMRDGRQAFFLFLPDGEDPDSLIRKEGTDGFEQRLRNATPLSEFFFLHQESETDLNTADGRARLAEKCRAHIASIPEGAFRDRLTEMLVEKSTIKWSFSPGLTSSMREKAGELLDVRLAEARGQHAEPHAAHAQYPSRAPSGGPNPRRSLVRTAIALLLQQPALAAQIEPPYVFAILRQPGIPLLMEILSICLSRPEITTAVLLEQFDGREDQDALRKLVMMEFPSTPEHWKAEFLDALDQLNRQTAQQRLDDLLSRQQHTQLSNDEKDEMRELLRSRVRTRSAP